MTLRLLVGLILVLPEAIWATGDDVTDAPWKVLTLAIDSGGSQAWDALSILGSVGNPEARSLLDKIFDGQDGSAMEQAALGLPPTLCVSYLPKLDLAAHGVDRGARSFFVLDAIRRAGTPEAARILAEIGDQGYDPGAAVAFGLLQQMGETVAPVLELEAIKGSTGRARNTAIYILRDLRAPGSIPTLRASLRDPSAEVRLAAALALAKFGLADGREQLEGRLRVGNLDEQIEPLVALAELGQAAPLKKLRSLLSGATADPTFNVRLVWAVARLGGARLKALVYEMGLERKPPYASMIVEKLLNPGDRRDLATMKELLVSGDPVSRLVAANRLLSSDSKATAESTIAKSLDSSDPTIRGLALGFASKDKALWPELADRLGVDSAATVAAIKAIMGLKRRDRFKDIVNYFLSDDRNVSLAAAKALAILDPVAAKSLFETQLQSRIAHVRVLSAGLLLALRGNNDQDQELILPQITD